MGDADRHNQDRRHQHPQRGALGAMVGAGALAEEDVQRPAHAGAEGIGGADQVERLGAVAQRQQQPDAEHRQADPEEVQQAPRGEDRHQQRPGELQGHRDAQRHGAHREIEQQVHAAQGDAVDHHRAQRLQAQALAPGT